MIFRPITQNPFTTLLQTKLVKFTSYLYFKNYLQLKTNALLSTYNCKTTPKSEQTSKSFPPVSVSHGYHMIIWK